MTGAGDDMNHRREAGHDPASQLPDTPGRNAEALRDGESTALFKRCTRGSLLAAKKKVGWHGRKGGEGDLGKARRTSNAIGSAARPRADVAPNGIFGWPWYCNFSRKN